MKKTNWRTTIPGIIISIILLWVFIITNKKYNTPNEVFTITVVYVWAIFIILNIACIMCYETKRGIMSIRKEEVCKTMLYSDGKPTGVYWAVIKNLYNEIIKTTPDVSIRELNYIYELLAAADVYVIQPFYIKKHVREPRTATILNCFIGYNILYLLRVCDLMDQMEEEQHGN